MDRPGVCERASYPSDLSDAEWVLLEPLLPAAASTGRPRGDLREILCGIFYVVDNGCKWRALPHDLPPWQTCWRWWARLNVAGEGRPSVWDEIVAALRGVDRVGKGRAQEPTAAIVDSPSARSSEGGQGRSFDTNKRVNGRKRHAFVDVEGNLLLVGLTGAGTSDTAAAKDLLAAVVSTYPSLRVIWCDQGYQASFVEAARALGLEVVVVCRQPGTSGFHRAAAPVGGGAVLRLDQPGAAPGPRLRAVGVVGVRDGSGCVRPDAAASAHLGSGGGLICT